MDGDLAYYTAALNIAKIKGLFDSGIRKDKSIDEALKNVNQNRTNIKNFIIELENSKNKCLDLLGESLYNRKREEYNKHIRNLSK